MGATPRFGLLWPELTDAPNGPAQFQQLAEGAEEWLCRAFPCTSSTRPTISDGSPFIIRESDTGDVKVWDGTAWVLVAPVVSGGGGGGGSSAIGTVGATYTAGTSVQSIPTGVNTTVAFGTAVTTDASVTRATSGAGHSFTLNQTRLWIITASLRFDVNATGARRFELRSGGSTTLAIEAAVAGNTEYTVNLAIARRLAAGTVITAHAQHDAGTNVPLDPNSGNYVHIDLAGI